jgi:predicted aspartyl protease
MNPPGNITVKTSIAVLFVLSVGVSALAAGPQDSWEKKKIDLRMPGQGRISEIRYPKGKEPAVSRQDRQRKQAVQSTADVPQTKALAATAAPSISVNVIDSPPIAGFVPWIAVATTGKKANPDDMDFNAHDAVGLTGVPTANITTNYTVGIFDTGASSHVMGYQAASRLGLNNSTYRTNNPIDISGVTGSVQTNVSFPLGIFAGGLNLLDPNGTDTSEYLLNNPAQMVGTWNTSIILGKQPAPGAPDLPTALGSPLNVFFTTVFKNDNPITIRHNGQEYTGPDIDILPQYSLSIPDDYPITIPLELRPLGGVYVQYLPDFGFYDLGGDLEALLNMSFDTPGSPSVVMGNLSQSVTFAASVDMTDNGNSSFDKNRFMLDTGAQVSVVGSRIGARLGLDPANPEFTVEIEGVDGTSIDADGFYIDSVNLPALGQWLKFTNVPVILLDVFSPEGGTLDGIIGMNLFTEYNMVFRGGGLFLTEDPALMLDPINPEQVVGDVEPQGGDGDVDIKDFAVFAKAWLTTPTDAQWNAKCDIAPANSPDGKVGIGDIALFADNWPHPTSL